MQRDMDLVREILFAIEKSPYTGSFMDIKSEGRTSAEVHYHLRIMAEAGLIDVQHLSYHGGGHDFYYPVAITWQGQEFLDAARDDTRWNRAKKAVVQKTSALSFEALKIVLYKLMTEGLT